MIDWRRDVIDRGLAEATDAGVAAELSSDVRTVRQLPLAAFRQATRELGILRQDPAGAYYGPLVDLRNAPQTDQGIRGAIDDLLTLMRDPTATAIATERMPYAGLFAALAGVLLQMKAIEPADLETIYAFAGGMIYGPTTEADVAAARSAYEAEQARTAIVSRLNEAQGAAVLACDQGGDAEAVKAAFDAAWLEG